jgi:hypothetical protein
MADVPQALAQAAGHGLNVPQGMDARGEAPRTRGRFGRMFPSLPAQELTEEQIDEILAAMMSGGIESDLNDHLPAGYTYLAQFIDHDITFDPTSKLGGDNDPRALSNFRTPRFDLDSLYGSGPADQPYLYDWDPDAPNPGVKLLLDTNTDPKLLAVDLPRNNQGRAIIGDARNDENAIISQLHLLFIHFHNRVVDFLAGPPTQLVADELFDEARRMVRWHYQWVVVDDFLPRIVGGDTVNAVRGWPARFLEYDREPYIPVEFSAAAYRFGHSMVRDSYKIDAGDRAPIFADPTMPEPARHLGGFRRLPHDVKIDWAHLYKLRSDTKPEMSRSIDLDIAAPLFALPAGVNKIHALPRLNLMRGRALELPSGQDVALAMGLEPLAGDALTLGRVKSPAANASVKQSTPLWFYILSEAANIEGDDRAKRLGPVGGRIVGEVLMGLLEADPRSYLRQWPAWQPVLPRADASFKMRDIARFAYPEGEYGLPGTPVG